MSEESRAMRAPNALRRPNKFIAYMRKYWFVYHAGAFRGLLFMLVFDYASHVRYSACIQGLFPPNLGVMGQPVGGPVLTSGKCSVDPNVHPAHLKTRCIINLYNLGVRLYIQRVSGADDQRAEDQEG